MEQGLDTTALGDRASPGSAAAVAAGTRPDLAFQRRILPAVSRTFALTIPELPAPLADVVANAYLLCRIADTIEDDPELGTEEKLRFADRFVEVVEGRASADDFAAGLAPRLAPEVPPAERELVANAPAVLRVTHACTPAERAALARCVRIMAEGMGRFQLRASVRGLADLGELDSYCYHVAGVVGEMLTRLFCEHSPAIAREEAALMPRAVAFGQGLQMTNILKDVWDDLERGACWLPRAYFAEHGFDLDDLARAPGAPGVVDPGFRRGLEGLIAIAHRHLADALDYTLRLPPEEPGLRRFCLWALGMAVLTLRSVHARPHFRSGQEVKISRRAVRATVLATGASVRSDRALRALFRLAGRGVPMAAPAR